MRTPQVVGVRGLGRDRAQVPEHADQGHPSDQTNPLGNSGGGGGGTLYSPNMTMRVVKRRNDEITARIWHIQDSQGQILA